MKKYMAIAAAAAVLTLAGCSKVNLENYRKILLKAIHPLQKMRR